LSRYRRLYVRESMAGDDSVISHGDLCFSNMFFGDERGKLLLIDPRGAENENELWMDPYYDVAKLSHSVLGGYDFFNAGLYDVSPELDLGLKLGEDKRRYMEIFQDYLEKNNYEQRRVRLCEASLFLSMLPMHVDDLKKTVGFILNADKILAEVENV